LCQAISTKHNQENSGVAEHVFLRSWFTTLNKNRRRGVTTM
jgi:hypothetical protein